MSDCTEFVRKAECYAEIRLPLIKQELTENGYISYKMNEPCMTPNGMFIGLISVSM